MKQVHRIAVISDTHGILRREVLDVAGTCEAILHAGDVGKPEILGQLREICPTYAVRGNVDQDLGGEKEELEAELFGFRFYMIHDRKQVRRELSDVDIVICGHTHQYKVNDKGKPICLNPGSCGPKRFRLPATMMLLTLCPAGKRIETEKILLSPASAPAETEPPQLSEKDMNRLVKAIMRDVDARRTVEDIAVRNHVSRVFAEQICRMYVTHPGVDVDGILDRMERRNL